MNIKSLIKKILFGINGIASVVFSIICFCMDDGSYEFNATYGGDAYTGIQNAAAQTACNVKSLADIVKFGFGSILMVAGLALIIYAAFSGTKSAPSQPSSVPFSGSSYAYNNSQTPVSAPAPTSVPVSAPILEPAPVSDEFLNINAQAPVQQNIQQ